MPSSWSREQLGDEWIGPLAEVLCYSLQARGKDAAKRVNDFIDKAFTWYARCSEPGLMNGINEMARRLPPPLLGLGLQKADSSVSISRG